MQRDPQRDARWGPGWAVLCQGPRVAKGCLDSCRQRSVLRALSSLVYLCLPVKILLYMDARTSLKGCTNK